MVETYLEKENEELVFDAATQKEWRDLVEDLNLEGQKGLIGSKKSPIPFRWINAYQFNVVEAVCPRHAEVKKYDRTPIPLEVLALVKLAESEGYFESILIHYDDKKDDPICIGCTGDSHYIIGRWGNELVPFQKLEEEALKRVSDDLVREATEKKLEAERRLANPEGYANKRLHGAYLYY